MSMICMCAQCICACVICMCDVHVYDRYICICVYETICVWHVCVRCVCIRVCDIPMCRISVFLCVMCIHVCCIMFLYVMCICDMYVICVYAIDVCMWYVCVCNRYVCVFACLWYVCVCTHVCHSMCRGQRTALLSALTFQLKREALVHHRVCQAHWPTSSWGFFCLCSSPCHRSRRMTEVLYQVWL